MNTIAITKQNDFYGKKILNAGILAIGLMSSLIMSTTANAGLVTGNATLTIDNSAVTSSIPFPGWVFDKHWGASNNTLAINASTIGGTSLSSTGSTALSFGVNTNTTTIVHAATDRTEQATTMDTSDTSTGKIGLSGALRLSDGASNLSPYDMYMQKNGGVWEFFTNGAGFDDGKIFTLVDAVESVNGSGELSLTGALYWATTGFNWTLVTGASAANSIGSFSLTPSAVPVPAAVWLFGSGLIGLIVKRRSAQVEA